MVATITAAALGISPDHVTVVMGDIYESALAEEAQARADDLRERAGVQKLDSPADNGALACPTRHSIVSRRSLPTTSRV